MSLRFYLRFTSRSAADTALKCLDGYMVQNDDGGLAAPGTHPRGPGWHGYHIGSIVATPAVLDDDGAEETPAVMDTRHHVNIMTTTDAAAQALKVGVDRVCFRFPTEPKATFQAGSDAEPSFWETAAIKKPGQGS